jgi:hypothetical protein
MIVTSGGHSEIDVGKFDLCSAFAAPKFDACIFVMTAMARSSRGFAVISILIKRWWRVNLSPHGRIDC